MAIDTENKKRSATSFITFPVFPIPDGDINEGDRAHIAGFYRGLFLVIEPLANFITIAKQFAFTTDTKVFSWISKVKIFAFTSKVKTIAFTTLKRIYNFITKEVL